MHDPSTFFVIADAHKTGDFTPYVFESSDLLFLGTEFGIYFTPNRGANWIKLGAGAPTIAFRDIKIHRRDEDLVGAATAERHETERELREAGEELARADERLRYMRAALLETPRASPRECVSAAECGSHVAAPQPSHLAAMP